MHKYNLLYTARHITVMPLVFFGIFAAVNDYYVKNVET